MRDPRTLRLALCAALLGATCAAAGPSPAEPSSATREGFDRILSLEGRWARVDESGAATDELVAVYASTAGGHALVETLFPGTPQQMTSVFHLEGDAVALTHYCMLGNRPHLRTDDGATGDSLEFTCTGLSPESQPHMHGATFTWPSADRLRTRWVQYAEGAQAEEVVLDLVRVDG